MPAGPANGATDALRALETCASPPGLLVFADSDWLCDAAAGRHVPRVAKVEPGVDDALLFESDRAAGPVRVAAIVDPRGDRHQPVATLMLLDRLKRDLGTRVEAISFGCTDEALSRVTEGWQPDVEHRGTLSGDEVATLLRGAHVFLDFSVCPATARGGLEAMAAGCAPVLPSNGAGPEVAVHDQDALLVDPLDREAAYAELFALVVDRARLARLQDGAAATARRHSMLRAALSQVALFEHERRAARRAGRFRRTRAPRR